MTGEMSSNRYKQKNPDSSSASTSERGTTGTAMQIYKKRAKNNRLKA